MKELESKVRIRKATEADVPFIFSSWLRSYRTSRFAGEMNNTIYFSEHHKVIQRLLQSCEVYIACSEKDGTDIYGWICAERVQGIFCLHFVYVKHTYRNLGIGKMLLNAYAHEPGLASVYTHQTVMALRLAAKFNMTYSPYIALTPDYRTDDDHKGELQFETDKLPANNQQDEKRKYNE